MDEGFRENVVEASLSLAAFEPPRRRPQAPLYYTQMSPRLLLALVAATLACGDAGRSRPPSAPPPAAEFILAAGDSAYWVTTGASGVHVRGAPIELAQLGQRFLEVYVVDDDHSFEGADLVGQSVYRRDLRSGDSTLVYTDSLVPALARQYAREHPDERRLRPDEDGADDPELRASATLEFSATHGAFVSFTLHTDVERAGAAFWHTSRNGVLDLRTGKLATLGDIAGRDAQSVERRRDDIVKMVMDSVRSRATSLVTHYQFDPSSFTITTVQGTPAITYAFSTSGTGSADQALPLPPLTFAGPAWWTDVVPNLPRSSADGAVDAFVRGPLSVLARYDSAGNGHVVLRDNTAHEWPLGVISESASRIYWLDHEQVDAQTRNALARAFDDAAQYGTDTHVAVRQPQSPYQLTRHTQ